MLISPRGFVAALCLAAGFLSFAGGGALAAEPLVSAAWVAAQLGNPHVVVLDLRPGGAHAQGHIPGAVSADIETAGWVAPGPRGAAGALPPVGRIAAKIGALGVGDADQVVIVADDFPAAARVYWTFKVLGHAEVSILDGGWPAWTGPVARGPVCAAAGGLHRALHACAARRTARGGGGGGRRWCGAGGCAPDVAMERRGQVAGGARRAGICRARCRWIRPRR